MHDPERARGFLMAATIHTFQEAGRTLEDAAEQAGTWAPDWLRLPGWEAPQVRLEAFQAAWGDYGAEVSAMPAPWRAEVLTWARLPRAPRVEFFIDPGFDEEWERFLES